MRRPIPHPLAILLSLVLAVLPHRGAGAQEAVRLTGSTTVTLNVFEEHQAKIAAAAGVQMKVFPSNSKQGVLDLLAGREDKVLKGRSVTEEARTVHSSPQIVTVVKQLPGAIGYATLRVDRAGTTAVKTDKELRQSLFLVTVGEPPERVAKVIKASVKFAGK